MFIERRFQLCSRSVGAICLLFRSYGADRDKNVAGYKHVASNEAEKPCIPLPKHPPSNRPQLSPLRKEVSPVTDKHFVFTIHDLRLTIYYLACRLFARALTDHRLNARDLAAFTANALDRIHLAQRKFEARTEQGFSQTHHFIVQLFG